MDNMKRSGKVALRSVDGAQASGVCFYNAGGKGMELRLSLQLKNPMAAPHAVLQFGPDRAYRCLPAIEANGTVKCGEPDVAALWVLDGELPVLFGLLGVGRFDAAEARRHLPGSKAKPAREQTQFKVATAAHLPTAEVPIALPAATAEAQAIPTFSNEDAMPAPVPKAESPHPAQTPDIRLEIPTQAQNRDRPVGIMSVPMPAEAPPALPAPPLVIKRAARPTPRPPVYSPLWDDVSAEFEKMLDSLPAAQPFNGSAGMAEIAELPTDGAVQCYIGSVTVNGVKVFLQAVPARPYARPAGFDHSLVSRSGDCYWVKYFIQSL